MLDTGRWRVSKLGFQINKASSLYIKVQSQKWDYRRQHQAWARSFSEFSLSYRAYDLSPLNATPRSVSDTSKAVLASTLGLIAQVRVFVIQAIIYSCFRFITSRMFRVSDEGSTKLEVHVVFAGKVCTWGQLSLAQSSGYQVGILEFRVVLLRRARMYEV